MGYKHDLRQLKDGPKHDSLQVGYWHPSIK